ncbi:MAG TPA: LCP family protein [Negativicutes bacterium]
MARLEKRLDEQKNIRLKKTAIIFGILCLMITVATASYYWFSAGLSPNRPSGGFLAAQNKINILVLGVDERSDDVGRSDTMFVITVDTATQEVAMLSVPRDTRVKIPGHGWDKINHAYAEGGHKLSKQAAEGLLGIPIDYYVTINIAGFKKVIDAIGGVTIDVEKRMVYNDPYDDGGGLVIDLKPGVQHMDGQTAIQYVRYRDDEGDIGRVARQQKFLKAMLAEVASPSVITKVPAIIHEINTMVKTDMSTGEMLNLVKILNAASKQGLRTDMVPGKPAYIDDISYWLPDLIALRQHVAQTLGVAMDEKYKSITQNEAAEYEKSIPREMKIVETPKAAQPVKPPTDPEKPKTTDKPNSPEKPSTISPVPPTPAKIKVEVINASGAADAGDKIAAILRSQGFEVTGVSNLTTPYKNTVVISNTTNSAVVNRLTGMPFEYTLQVTKDDTKATQATVVVGKDYTGK